MDAFEGVNWLRIAPFLLLNIIPGFLPLIIKRPEGPNRFGLPYEPKDIADAVRACLKRYVGFTGRATRMEFWSFFVAAIVVHIVALSTAYVTHIPFELVSFVGLLLPTLAVGVRRLHDINRNGWWLLLGLTGLGMVALLCLWLVPSQRGVAKLAQRPRIVI